MFELKFTNGYIFSGEVDTVDSRYLDFAYLENNHLSRSENPVFFKHENLTRDKILFSIYLQIQDSNYIFICEMWLFDLFFSLILQIWYVEVRISWSNSESPLDFEITRVDCIIVILSIQNPEFLTIHTLTLELPYTFPHTGSQMNLFINSAELRSTLPLQIV